MDDQLKSLILLKTGAQNAQKLETIQQLWSGYGEIMRVSLEGAEVPTIIVKVISAASKATHPRGWDEEVGHQRKVKSYAVEIIWYQEWNSKGGNECRTPGFLGYLDTGKYQYILLEDLNAEYPRRRDTLSIAESKACLKWLASFHATFMHQKPQGIWEQGTYWHLDTRKAEWTNIVNAEVKEKAKWIDQELKNAKYQTIVHGDAKVANFCFAADEPRVAAVDFQYVGKGCGMKDVAYFLGSCLNSNELQEKEPKLLQFYFDALSSFMQKQHPKTNFMLLEKEWRRLYNFACADFARFLLGWMPTHHKLNAHLFGNLDEVLRVSRM